MSTPLKPTTPFTRGTEAVLNQALSNVINVYHEASADEKPGVVAEIVRFSRETLSKLHPELLDNAADATTEAEAKATKKGKPTKQGKTGGDEDAWISSDSGDDTIADADSGDEVRLAKFKSPAPNESVALIEKGVSGALRPRLDRLMNPLSQDLSPRTSRSTASRASWPNFGIAWWP